MKTAVHVLRYLIGLEQPNTQTTQVERNCLAAFAAGKHRLVELGVYEGVSTNVLGSAMAPTGVLYAIDPFMPGRLGFCWSELVARREAARTHRDIVFVKLLSRDAARAIQGDFEMIFIDADHSLDCVIRRKAASDSDVIRPPIPTEVGHPFRLKPATLVSAA